MYNTVPNAKALGNCLIKTRLNRRSGGLDVRRNIFKKISAADFH